MPEFVVIAHRRNGSVFGAATAICKDADGKEKTYPTRDAADSAAKRYNDRTTSPNVYYTVEEMAR
jgi:hypothetical protein